MMSDAVVSVNLGEVKVSDNPGVALVCYGLGSCVALAAYEGQARVAGMAHVVLPSSAEGRSTPGAAPAQDGRFADTAVPALVRALVAKGANRSRLVIKMAGGAQVLALSAGPFSEIGRRNVVAVKQALAAAGLAPAVEDTGGNAGRTMRFEVGSGRVTVSSVGRRDRDL
jgi:chemotaxis protein CheD